jgi:hypothetical protein
MIMLMNTQDAEKLDTTSKNVGRAHNPKVAGSNPAPAIAKSMS